MARDRSQPSRRPVFERLGALAVRRRRRVLVATVLFVLVAAGASGNVVERLSSAGFDDPGSESTRAGETLERRFGIDVPKLVLLVSTHRSVDDPSVARTATRLARRLSRERGIERVESYWTSGPAGGRLRSRDGSKALILAQVAGDDDAVAERAKELGPEYRGGHGELKVGLTGLGPLIAETEEQVKKDLTKAEAIALPLTLLALFLVFRGLVAALLPLAIGGLSIIGTLLALRVLSEVASVSVFAVNLATALGLGLAIDYSLLIVARYRDELRGGLSPGEAIPATMRTTGRTVVFSAVIVAVSLAALLVFPMYYLRSFAYAGVAVVTIAAVGAVVVLPALLAVIGPRIDALSLKPRRPARSGDTGFWHRFATITMRRPLPIATGAIAVLLVLGAPFLHASFGFSDDRNLPESTPSRQVSDQIRAHLPVRESGTLFVVSERAPAGKRLAAQTGDYARRLSQLDGVASVEALTGSYRRGKRVLPPRGRHAGGGATWLAVETTKEPFSAAGEGLARTLRSTPAPFPVEVTGTALRSVDTKDELAERLPIALAVIALTTFLGLLVMTGSLLAPVKAIVLNVLSLTAVFGAMVYVFQDGHLQWLVGDFALTGSINVLNPPLMFCIAFGLSMDYHVFMLSSIKEEYDRRRDNRGSIAGGLQRTGPIITAAAVLVAIVLVAFSTSGVTNVKMIGLGMALAVVMDATLVRAALVPAFMRLIGRFNWWAPAPLRRLIPAAEAK